MGIRESLNKNPKLTTGVALGVAVLAVGAMALRLSGRGAGAVAPAFYTVDDGATWFEDDGEKLPPFQHEGKEAVRAHVFECSDGKRSIGIEASIRLVDSAELVNWVRLVRVIQFRSQRASSVRGRRP